MASFCHAARAVFHMMAVMSHAYLIVLEWNSANRLTQAVQAVPLLDDDGGGGALSLADTLAAPFMNAQSPWHLAGSFVGEVLGTLTMIVAVNCLRRIALMMTNPFGDE